MMDYNYSLASIIKYLESAEKYLGQLKLLRMCRLFQLTESLNESKE